MSATEKREKRSHIWTREECEWYQEPLWTSERLFDVETFPKIVWDPAAGGGNIIRSAKAAGYEVAASDLVDRGFPLNRQLDFFQTTTAGAAAIVANPPFNRFREFAEHALAIGAEKVALIWTVRTLPAARWLQETPLARIWFLTPRPSMPPGQVIARGEKPGGGMADYCWIVFEKGYSGAPTAGWLHRDGKP